MNEDARAKLGLQALLSPFVSLLVHHEVQPPAQFVDLYVSAPPSSPEAMIQTLGVLGRMACQPALLEAFSDTVTLDEVRDCIRKQLTLHHTLTLDAHRQRRAGSAAPRVPFPWLWVLSLGEPRAVLDGWLLTPSGRWPLGVYRSQEAASVAVVVLRELQHERETLALRMFGDEAMRQQAAREIQAMEPEEGLRLALGRVLYRWSVWSRSHPEDEQTRRRLMDFEQLLEQETQRLRLEGRREGRLEGERRALQRVLGKRGLAMSEEQRQRVDACSELATLERWLEQAVTAESAEEALR